METVERKEKSVERDGKKLNRRGFFRLATGLFGGMLFLRAATRWRRENKPIRLPKVTVLSECVGCTGCVAACPTNALFVAKSRITVSEKLCIRCGYCVAICPVNGLRVNREYTDA